MKLESRLAKWKKTGVARNLWPDVPRSHLVKAHQIIWDSTAACLAGDTATVQTEDVGGGRPLSIASMISGMGPLFGYWSERGELTCDPVSGELFGRYLTHGRRRAYRMETALTAILQEAWARSVTPTVLKGMYTARKFFPEPGTRPSADIDLLVRPEALEAMRDALAAAGLAQATQPAFKAETWKPADTDDRIPSIEFDDADTPWSVDLHTSIDRPYFRGRWSQFGSAAFALTERWSVRQQAALVMAQPLLLAHLAQHTSRDIMNFRLMRLVELVLVIRGDNRIRWDACHALLQQCEITRFVYPAFTLAERLAPGTVDAQFLEQITSAAPRATRAAVERLAEDPLGNYFRRSPSQRLMWTSGFREYLMGWSDVFWPTGFSLPEQLRVVRRRFRMLIGR